MNSARASSEGTSPCARCNLDLHVGDTVEGSADVAVGIALVGPESQRDAAYWHLVLRGDILHARDQVDETQDADVSVQRRVLDRGAVDHETDRGGLGLDHG